MSSKKKRNSQLTAIIVTAVAITAVAVVAVFILTASLGGSEEAKRNEEPADKPQVTLKTTEGEFTIGLLQKNAPNTCGKFLSWCKGMDTPSDPQGESRLYMGLQFYRVKPGKFVQGGDPFNKGIGADPFKIPFEKTYKPMKRGVVCMANDGQGNNSSIFFILLVDNPKLEGKYTAFGVVTSGLDVVDKMSYVPTIKDENGDLTKPAKPITIIGIEVNE